MTATGSQPAAASQAELEAPGVAGRFRARYSPFPLWRAVRGLSRIPPTMMLALLLAAAPVFQSDRPDLITLKDGKEVECRVLFEDDDTLLYTKKRKVEELALSEVQSVQSIERSLREALERFDQVGNNVRGLLELANFCEGRELLAEARHLRIRVLTMDPENDEAWTKLGGSHSKRKGWRMKVRGRFYSLEQLRERVGDWKNAMELPTAHFLIKTDGSPERALDLAIDIERAYLTFYDLLGGSLRLYPFDEVPEIHIYASGEDYRSPPRPGQVAWFAPGANILYVNAETATNAPHSAVFELTDVLLFNAFRRTVGKSGSMPPWARNGIALAFGAAYRRDPGHASWDLSTPIQAYFEAQANADDPLTLKEVVRAGFASYNSGTQAELYSAQSYTLAHFLAHGDDQSYRSGFGQYLLSSFKGKSALSHLEKALNMKDSDIQKRWVAHVKLMSGS